MRRFHLRPSLIGAAFFAIVAGSALLPGAAFAAAGYSTGQTGYDISWPQCGGAYPPASAIAIVGFNDGKAETANPCFGSEFNSWAHQPGSIWGVYLNTNAPSRNYVGKSKNGTICKRNDALCNAYSFGVDSANYNLQHGLPAPGVAGTIWLDVETMNTWTQNTSANAQVLQGMVDMLVGDGYTVGIYSTSYQFGKIAGSYAFPNNPNPALWIPGAGSLAGAPSFCQTATRFANGSTVLVQWTATFDENYAC